ncbi:hypothetical protein MA9V1_122 [Chryseobacterium phage MA9V-1]|nr:hypothetical protein MA9V1_122 [Chryseobacterium phage MA9V-1]
MVVIVETIMYSAGIGGYLYYEFKHWICRNKASELHKNVLNERDAK